MIPIGTKISWLTLVNGKITRVEGKITDLVGDYYKSSGFTKTGVKINDLLSVQDKSISII